MNTTSESLSERELEILKLVATGASNKEIASDLVISTNTVKVHLRNIYTKIGVNSRTEAAMYAVNEGIISISPDSGEDIPGSKIGETSKNHVNWGIVAALLLPIVVLFIVVVVLILINTRSEPAPIVPSDPEIRWEELASLPASQTSMAVAVIDNQIYSIAGKSEGVISNLGVKYVPQENKWERIPPKPTAVTDIGAAVIGNLIYVPGGLMQTGEVFTGLEIYDPRSGVWTAGTPVPVPVSSYAIAAYEGKLYLFGGWDGEDYLDQVLEYDPEEDRWEEKTPLPSGRRNASAVSSGGSIYVIGGYGGEEALADVDIYTPSLDKGSEDPWRSAASLPEGRYGLGSVEISDVIYVIGGESRGGQELSPLSFSTQDQTWQKLIDQNPRKWTYLGLASLGPKIYAIGGVVNNLPSKQTSAYQLLYITVLPIVP